MPWITAAMQIFGVGQPDAAPIQGQLIKPPEMNPLLVAALAIGGAIVIGGGTYLVLRK